MEPSNSLPLIEARLLFWSRRTKYTLCSTLSHFRLHLRGSQLLCSTFENFIDMTKLRTWLWYHVRNHNSPHWYGIVHFEHKLGLPQKPHSNRDVFLTYKPMIIPQINQCETPSQQSATSFWAGNIYILYFRISHGFFFPHSTWEKGEGCLRSSSCDFYHDRWMKLQWLLWKKSWHQSAIIWNQHHVQSRRPILSVRWLRFRPPCRKRFYLPYPIQNEILWCIIF